MAIALRKTKHATPPRLVIHGGPKVGKSTFAATLPNPVFLPTEDGLNGIDVRALTEEGKSRLETFIEFNMALAWCEQNPGEFDSLVIDSLDWLETLIFDSICAKYEVATIEAAAGGYGKGYTEALVVWNQVIQRLDALNKMGKVICCICHSKAIEFNDPSRDSYDVWEMKLHASKKGQGALNLLKEWADVIGFAEVEKHVSKQAGSEKALAVETGNRILHVNGLVGIVAGNRYGVRGPLPLEWSQLAAALTQ